MPRKKLLYVPGLFSLVVLPIMLIAFSPEDPQYKTCLKFFIPSDENVRPTNGQQKHSKYWINEFLKSKRITSIYLAGLPAYDNDEPPFFNVKLNFLSDEIRRLQFTLDSNNVLKVVLDDDFQYKDFVWLVNQMTIWDIKRFALVADSFYIISNGPPVHHSYERTPLDPIAYDLNVPKYDPPTNWQIMKWRIEFYAEEWKYYLKHNYILVFAFLTLILLPGILGARQIRRSFPSTMVVKPLK